MHIPDGSHSSATEAVERAAAAAGDEEAFRRLTEHYRRELHVHCYRMLGSFHDAEDALQETLLRAWRHLASFEGRSSLRAWLYRIATNVCLTAAARPRVEPAPPPAPPAAARTAGIEHVTHLSPYPDQLLDELEATAGNPVAHYDLRESVHLAFLAAVQMLPPRQRAVLLLRDVLGWSSGEVAALLDSTTASVNSALQRARATVDQQHTEGRLGTVPTASREEIEQSLVRRYIEAWEAVDLDRLVGLLRSDAVLTMPPFRLRYEGRRAIAAFFATIPSPGAVARRRLMPTRANRQPAVAAYMLDPGGLKHRASALVVLSVEAEAIAAITGFVDPTLFPVFGLPTELASDHAT
jgi:RNA polymerase sigma-70 factor (ECF subfamily)